MHLHISLLRAHSLPVKVKVRKKELKLLKYVTLRFKQEALVSAALTLSGSILRTCSKSFNAFSILPSFICAFPLDDSADMFLGSLERTNSASSIALSNCDTRRYC